MKAIIADTSCLILFDKIKQFQILQKTFPDLIITKEVAEEFGELPTWINIKEIINKEKYLELNRDLGKGEASSIV